MLVHVCIVIISFYRLESSRTIMKMLQFDRMNQVPPNDCIHVIY